jgi:hypothetical protein
MRRIFTGLVLLLLSSAALADDFVGHQHLARAAVAALGSREPSRDRRVSACGVDLSRC